MAMDASCQLDPAQTAARITDLAVKLIPCAAADIIRVKPSGQIRVSHSSDPGLSDLSETICHQWPHPLSLGAVGENRPTDERNQGYSRRLNDDCGIEKELTFALRVGPADHGYLRLLFRSADDSSAQIEELAAAFARHATLALDRSVLQAQVASLLTAMESNREIGVAVGVLMARRSITYQQAFALLKASSQNDNRKLREVAADVLYTCLLYTSPSPRD